MIKEVVKVTKKSPEEVKEALKDEKKERAVFEGKKPLDAENV